MAMPSVMATRWMGQNSGPIVCYLWTKVNLLISKFFGRQSTLQDHFLNDNILLHCEDIHNKVKNVLLKSKFKFFDSKILRGLQKFGTKIFMHTPGQITWKILP